MRPAVSTVKAVNRPCANVAPPGTPRRIFGLLTSTFLSFILMTTRYAKGQARGRQTRTRILVTSPATHDDQDKNNDTIARAHSHFSMTRKRLRRSSVLASACTRSRSTSLLLPLLLFYAALTLMPRFISQRIKDKNSDKQRTTMVHTPIQISTLITPADV